MTKHIAKFSCALIAAMTLTGCIDNGYDLSDIDTTTQVKVKDLIIPLNMEDVKLSDIITVNEGDKIQEVTINGKTFYAVQDSGKFHSDPVKIPSFEVKSTPISSNTAAFKLTGEANRRSRSTGAEILSYALKMPVNNALKYIAGSIDDAINSLDAIGVSNLTLQIDFTLKNASQFSAATLKDLQLTLPKGMSIKPKTRGLTDANYINGMLTIPQLTLEDGKCTLEIQADALNLKANGVGLESQGFTLDSQFDISKATAELIPTNANSTPLPEISFDLDYKISDFNATSFTGYVEYDIDGNGLNINPIHLTDLPSFLDDQRTNLILSNPQIYLQINNPVGENNLDYSSGLNIISQWDGSEKQFPFDKLTIPHTNGAGPYNFCLSPMPPEDVPAGYSKNLQPETYHGLGDILSGNGLPESLDLKLVKPQIFNQYASDFKLGRNLPGMEGKYLLLAPLALKGNSTSGSVIIYSDTKNDWNNSELDNLTIETLELMADVTSTIPFSATLEAYPLDKEGNRIMYTAADGSKVPVTVSGAVIPAGAKDEPIKIIMEGVITDLDGVTFEAVVRPDGKDTPLAPSQNIVLKNLKAKVGGYYTTDF